MQKNLRNSKFVIQNSGFRIQTLDFRLSPSYFRLHTSGGGFTSVEMMIVIAIILIFTALIVIDYHSNQADALLQASAIQLGQNLRRAQDLSTLSQEFGGAIPRGGYGINVRTDQTTYTLFADCNNDHAYEDLTVCGQGQTLSEKFEEFKLESGVVFSKISPGDPQNIVFTPPLPTVTFSPAGSLVEITLALAADPNKRRTVFINQVGLIKVK
jgi:type II secretory pathway pseudopilin PulG